MPPFPCGDFGVIPAESSERTSAAGAPVPSPALSCWSRLAFVSASFPEERKKDGFHAERTVSAVFPVTKAQPVRNGFDDSDSFRHGGRGTGSHSVRLTMQEIADLRFCHLFCPLCSAFLYKSILPELAPQCPSAIATGNACFCGKIPCHGIHLLAQNWAEEGRAAWA